MKVIGKKEKQLENGKLQNKKNKIKNKKENINHKYNF